MNCAKPNFSVVNQTMSDCDELNRQVCQHARESRDARFDGTFFTAVKTTGIYCRPICPATTPKEENVEYFGSAIAAANAGYRPCLRCRPDSAPGSPAWQGVNTTFNRALKLIDQGGLNDHSLVQLAQRLGITDRYLRRLFTEHLGASPKAYALYQQCLFAKQLLHQTNLSVTDIALASGFNSVRRFNDCFKQQLKLTPTQVRRAKPMPLIDGLDLQLKLDYRPPYNWQHMQRFLSDRHIVGLEWVDQHSYGRTFDIAGNVGHFTAKHIEYAHRFDVTLVLNDAKNLQKVVQIIRRILDLDSDVRLIEQHLLARCGADVVSASGLRLPGTWSVFEAGVRAILGQQVSVVAAHKLVTVLVTQLGKPMGDKRLFPSPNSIINSDLAFFKMPGARKATLKNLARHYLEHGNPDDLTQWSQLKGIGPWTVDYASLRGLSSPDIFLAGDAGVKKALQALDDDFNPQLASPWRSYLTFHLWSTLGSL